MITVLNNLSISIFVLHSRYWRSGLRDTIVSTMKNENGKDHSNKQIIERQGENSLQEQTTGNSGFSDLALNSIHHISSLVYI